MKLGPTLLLLLTAVLLASACSGDTSKPQATPTQTAPDLSHDEAINQVALMICPGDPALVKNDLWAIPSGGDWDVWWVDWPIVNHGPTPIPAFKVNGKTGHVLIRPENDLTRLSVENVSGEFYC
ncbi:MAG: hypothetical protein WEB04_00075 [Dehalococcoidia bacterium]